MQLVLIVFNCSELLITDSRIVCVSAVCLLCVRLLVQLVNELALSFFHLCSLLDLLQFDACKFSVVR